MRFTASVIGPSRVDISKRAVMPGNFIRLDDNEQFRLCFENDWDQCGLVSYVYDANNCADSTKPKVTRMMIEPANIEVSEELFTYERTKRGRGRLLEIKWTQEGHDDVVLQFMLINNDFTSDCKAVLYGDVSDPETDACDDDDDGEEKRARNRRDVVKGVQFYPALNPDAHWRATM